MPVLIKKKKRLQEDLQKKIGIEKWLHVLLGFIKIL